MKTPILPIAAALLGIPAVIQAHDWNPRDLPPIQREALRAQFLEDFLARQSGPGERRSATALVADGTSSLQAAAAVVADAANAPAAAKPFLAFPKLEVKWDRDHLFVGSNGLPAHNMMVGITAWQQQVPLPQAYFGENAWRIPLHPVPAKEPAMIKGRFLRGAIALAVNGIPIFNPQNNRGEISLEIGELDQWGGHCGRADDYHYHIAPLHLEAAVGKGMPVAYALDGYPIYGLTEPDGSPVAGLDECHGHETAELGYHYHAATSYPYVIGGFHGEVVEAEGQVDPQPHAQPVREALQALRGAEITGFESTAANAWQLTYDLNGETRYVRFQVKADGTYPFEFDNGRDGIVKETYTARSGGGGRGKGGPGGPGRPGEPGGRKGGGKGGPRPEMREGDRPPPPPPARPEVFQGIIDLNGDGIVTAQEFADHARTKAAKRGESGSQVMEQARREFRDLDRDGSGQLEPAEWQEAPGAPPRSAEMAARDGRPDPGGMRGGGNGGQNAAAALPDQPRSSDGVFFLTSPEVEDGAEVPADYTGDGSGATLPLQWKGAPAGTKSYALIMDHRDPRGEMKWYWTLYDLPGDLTSLPKNVEGVGKVGTGFKGKVGYEPPHSQGPGAKTYVLNLYALSAPLEIGQSPGGIGRTELLAAMQGKVLASSSLRIVNASSGDGPVRREKPPVQGVRSDQGKGKGKGGPPGLVKPSIDDTMKLNVYADNWFLLYVNGRLVAVDPIQFTPHNVVSVDFLPEYPMTIAVLAKDNADPKTGLEYGSSIGDGGFILKFADGTVTNATWKAKNFFHGPVNGDTANPQVRQEALPDNWWAVDFDDSTWANAREYGIDEVDPKQPYYEHDFEGAKFIWTDDLALDNTIIFRTKIEKPGWTPRWNTKPDLDVTGAPSR